MTMLSPQPTILKKPTSLNPENGNYLESGQSGIPNNNPTDVGATSKEHESKQSYIQGFRLHLIITACVPIYNGLAG